MCVGFLYTLVSSLPSGSLVTRVSRKAILLLFSVSIRVVLFHDGKRVKHIASIFSVALGRLPRLCSTMKRKVRTAERTHSEGEKIKSFEVVIALVLRKMTL